MIQLLLAKPPAQLKPAQTLQPSLPTVVLNQRHALDPSTSPSTKPPAQLNLLQLSNIFNFCLNQHPRDPSTSPSTKPPANKPAPTLQPSLPTFVLNQRHALDRPTSPSTKPAQLKPAPTLQPSLPTVVLNQRHALDPLTFLKTPPAKPAPTLQSSLQLLF